MKHKRRVLITTLALLLGALAGLGGANSLGAQSSANLPADLQVLVAESLKANPEIKQMGEIKNASKETIRSAGALDDPELGVALNDVPTDTWRLNQDPMTQKMVEVSQKFPFPGKRRLRSEVAAEQTRSDEFSYQDKANEVRAKVVMGYWSLSQAYDSYDLTAKNKEFWERVVQVVETRFKVGTGQQADVLKAQVELGNYLDRLFRWSQRQESVRADLNALRNQPPKTPIPRPQPLKSRPFNLRLDDLVALAEDRPQLQALKALITKQEKAVDLARKEYFPDATIGVGYAFREALRPPVASNPDQVTGRVMINLPIWREAKIKPRIREEEARQRAAAEGHQNAWNQLKAMINDRFVKLQRLDQQIELYNQAIVPQARQAAEASLAAYQVGTQDFARLLQDVIDIYNAELQLQEYLMDFESNWAELEWLVGKELPRRLEARQ